ncbi:hypothetical protein PABG_12533 [Paracoccidioides brasiliensis Pb03]|nr:hypothetical protein PABG_12533 [Paracoccidioides brasiliensis Pb03]
METKLTVDGEAIGDGFAQAAYICSRLREDALKRFYPWALHTARELRTPIAVVGQLDKLFLDPARANKAMQWLQTSKARA